jgi:hypothetical protein
VTSRAYRCVDCRAPDVELSPEALELLEASNRTLAKLRRPALSPAEFAVCGPCYQRRRKDGSR